jgi:hypothetical protein
MKMRLDKMGHLSLDRGHGMDTVCCPYQHVPNDDGALAYRCGEWCALFGAYDPKAKRLDLCHGQYIEGELVDDRDVAENKENP